MQGPCFVVCFLVPFSSFAIILLRKEREGDGYFFYCVLSIVVCLCSVSILRGAIKWSAIVAIPGRILISNFTHRRVRRGSLGK